MRRIATVYAVIAIYIGTERFLRKGRAATSLEEQETDEGSTRAITRALAISMISLSLAPLLNRLHIAVMPRQLLWFRTGISLMLAGVLLRAWANRVLGTAYTRTLRVVPEQSIIQEGPYRAIRHPGYLGTLLVWLGGALALANWLVLAVSGAALLRAYHRRMESEERMLLASFGEVYRSYRDGSKRLLPLLY